MNEWWATAPTYGNYHTWDETGKVWWKTKPWFDLKSNSWTTDFRKPLGSIFLHYDMTPCPVEIDPSKTLRRRPKEPAL